MGSWLRLSTTKLFCRVVQWKCHAHYTIMEHCYRHQVKAKKKKKKPISGFTWERQTLVIIIATLIFEPWNRADMKGEEGNATHMNY